jgi:tyrosine phenol-lyase
MYYPQSLEPLFHTKYLLKYFKECLIKLTFINLRKLSKQTVFPNRLDKLIGVQDDHIRSRIEQVRYLGNLLINWGIPIVRPVGGHAIFLNAKSFYSHLSQDKFPAQTLAVELYLDSGVQSMERGIVSAGRDPETGDHRYPVLELTRLAIPRRVYTQAHMDVASEAIKAVFKIRKETKGLKMIYEPNYLCFFQARFKKIK